MCEIQASSFEPVDPEFVVMLACRDMRMAAGHNVGIYADRRRRSLASGCDVTSGLLPKNFQLSRGFAVEEKNATFSRAAVRIAKRVANLFPRLSDARENDAPAGNADAAQAIEFPAGNNVEAAAEPSENAENRQIAVRFHGVANRMRKQSEGAVKKPVRRLNRLAAVYVDRRTDLIRDARKRYAFAMQNAGFKGPSVRCTISVLRRVLCRIETALARTNVRWDFFSQCSATHGRERILRVNARGENVLASLRVQLRRTMGRYDTGFREKNTYEVQGRISLVETRRRSAGSQAVFVDLEMEMHDRDAARIAVRNFISDRDIYVSERYRLSLQAKRGQKMSGLLIGLSRRVCVNFDGIFIEI